VILPPLSISKAELGRLLAILRSALDEVSARLNTKGVGL
jgi:adenosylmethionine-8-amino-7-oxononanoate aminotransferase